MKNLIIDCEALDTSENAIIPMFAALVTDDQLPIKDNLKNMIILHPSIEEQSNRTKSADALQFWNKQPKEVYDVVMSQENSLSLKECRDKFKTFLKEKGFYGESNAFIWQRGSKDLDWLNSLFLNELDLNWWSVRDIRTAIDILGASSAQNGYMDAGKISDEGTLMLMKLNDKGKAHHPAYDVVRDFIFLRSLKIV